MQLFFRGGKGFTFIGIVMIVMALMVFIFPKFFAFVFAGFVLLLGLFFLFIGLFSVNTGAKSDSSSSEDKGFSEYEEIKD